MVMKYIITDCCIVTDGTAADEASDNGSDAGDADSTADKDGPPRTTAISSKLHIVTNKVTLAVIIIFLLRNWL